MPSLDSQCWGTLTPSTSLAPQTALDVEEVVALSNDCFASNNLSGLGNGNMSFDQFGDMGM